MNTSKPLFKDFGYFSQRDTKPRKVDKKKFESNFEKIDFGPSPAKEAIKGKGRTTYRY